MKTFKTFMAESTDDPLAPLNHEVWFNFARSGGPGGQNVNKVNSKAILSWDVAHSRVWNKDVDAITRFQQMFGNKINKDGLVIIACQNHRDQPSNKTECMDKLRAMVQQALVPPVQRIMPQPDIGANPRRRADKIANSARKQSRSFVPDFD